MVNGKLIEKPRFKDEVIYEQGDTNDIMTVILSTVKDDIETQTAAFAKQFKPTKREMSRLWSWTKNNFIYKEDDFGVQWIREPARAWQERRKGIDCKSFTVFLCSIFKNLNLDFKVRFVSYSMFSKTPTHVYPLVKVENEWVIMDCVWNKWNSEKAYSHKIDKVVMTKISRMSGIGKTEDDYLRELHNAMKNIPDSIVTAGGGDVLQMTEGKFARTVAANTYEKKLPLVSKALRAGSVSGIYGIGSHEAAVAHFIEKTRYMNAPAFEYPALGNIFKRAWNGVKNVGKKIVTAVKTVGGKVINVVKSAAKWVGDQFKKLLNWIVKIGLPKVASFFLFTFAKQATPEIAKKADKQNKLLGWIGRLFSMDRGKIDAILREGIVKKFGKQPEQVLADRGIKGIGAAQAVIALIPMVIDIIKKIAALFKTEAPQVSADDASNLDDINKPGANIVVQEPSEPDAPPPPPIKVNRAVPNNHKMLPIRKPPPPPRQTEQTESYVPQQTEQTESYVPPQQTEQTESYVPPQQTEQKQLTAPKENGNMMMILAVVGIGAALYLSNKS